jgi:3-deoxy-D-manno-octulosonate 8-phosphate phosphatase (KDO 8-P phosphatase)
MEPYLTLALAAKPIELLLSDVDGVLTDGRLAFDNQGIETKQFHIRDGMGIKLWQKAGHRFGVITSRTSQIVKVRAAELGVEIVRQGFEEKLPVVKELVEQLGLTARQVAYIGDDLPDLPVLTFVGLGITVADAAREVRSAARHVTQAAGGFGAVREVVEMILQAQGRWDDLVSKYRGP